MPLNREETMAPQGAPTPGVVAEVHPEPEVTRPQPAVPGPRQSSPATPRPKSPGEEAGGSPSTQIRLVPATDDSAVEVADETVDGLLEGGCAPGEVLVLTTGEPHPWARHELSFGEQSYWAQLTEGTDVFCAAATDSLAGTRRDTVVVAVNGGTDEEVAEALPRAMAAAERELVVCGDPGRLRTLF